MRILHVGFGFSPWIVNGLVLYAEDLMAGQALRGEEVGYFFAARQLPRLRRPMLHRWRRGGVVMFEWMNSPVVVGRDRGTPDPERDLHDPPTETAFARVLSEFRPDVVHVHDLGGLPSSILGIAQDRGLPVVMTLHDYQALCPTIKLYDAEGQNCERVRPGDVCVVCCAGAPVDNAGDVQRTVIYARARIRSRVPYLDEALRHPAIERVSNAGLRLLDRLSGVQGADAEPPDAANTPCFRRPRASARAYDRRREINVQRLNRLDALITPSAGASEVWCRLGVRADRIHTLPLARSDVERLRPKPCLHPGEPLRFAILNGASSAEKGADLIVFALSELARRGLEHRFRLTVHGVIPAHVRAAFSGHRSVVTAGEYRPDMLDQMLNDVDVGLMPSVWQEVYGFAGIEFLAKGIPVIGNARGGIPEYVRPGETGWLNTSCSGQELADLMENAIDHPNEVQRLSESVVRLRPQLVKPCQTHLADLENIYAKVTSARQRLQPGRALGAPSR